MRLSTCFVALLLSLSATALQAQPAPGNPPPREARERPEAGPGGRQAPRDRPPREGKQRYSLEQALSDHAQRNTIAFNGLAFLSGNFAMDTFLPPGKVSDYFGFQYLRDIDAVEGGHSPQFLTRIADNLLAILDAPQKARLIELAKTQETDIRRFAELRYPLIHAFRRTLDGKLPAGSSGLDRQAVQQASAELYALDGQIALQRAQVMAAIWRSFSVSQKTALARLKFGDSRTWPEVGEQIDRRSLSHPAHVAVMTYASELFAWVAGSLEADTYFCPERHGMYFGGFGLKTAPAMGKQDYAISTALTGDSGEAFLALLDEGQRQLIDALPEQQRPALTEIVRVRREIAGELRRLLNGDAADPVKIARLSRRYGELDGELSWRYATAFARIGQSLTANQRTQIKRLRGSSSGPSGPFLYSDPIAMPSLPNTDQFFTQRSSGK